MPNCDTIQDPPLLEVKDLRVSFFHPEGEVKAVDRISYTVGRGRVMGIVGESGSGKSVQAYSILGLVPPPGRVIGGNIFFDGCDVLSFTPEEFSRFRGKQVSMVFQNPMTSLNPLYPIGAQLVEAFRAHNRTVHKSEVLDRAVGMLARVGLQNPKQCMKQYPYQLSGGMRQRVMIAMALICSPKLLIADEPTTALDVTIQAQILDLLRGLQQENGMGILFITHNLGVVAELCDQVSVMYAGKIVEQGEVDDIFFAAAHPYTLGLLRSMPRLDREDQGKLIPIPGTPADPLHRPSGCPFAPRCGACMEICQLQPPPTVELGGGHRAACWLCAEREGSVNIGG